VASEAAAWPGRPEPGTLDDLISDAAHLGLEFNERLARDWHHRGLLGSPTRQPRGRGKGSDPGIYSPQQRALFQAIARNRANSISHKTLAALPVWAWLHLDGWVEPSQLRHALKTAVGIPRPSGPAAHGATRVQLSKRVAKKSAQHLLGVLDHNHGRPVDRRRLLDELTRQLERGRINETALLPKVRAVFEPSRVTVVRGPAGAGLSAEAATSILSTRLFAANHLDQITDEQLLTARQQHLASLAEYTQLRETLAQQAGSLRQLFRQPASEEQVLSSVPTLLYLVGLQMRRQQDAARRERP
jgi:hypothetical protein